MSEPPPIYYADLIPTDAELKLLSRLRQLREALKQATYGGGTGL